MTSTAAPAASSSESPSAPTPPPSATLLSGALSGLASCVLLQPLDLLKTRLQQANTPSARIGGKTKRLLRTVDDVVKKDGVVGLWRGTLPTVLRNVPGVALYFYSVTEARRALSLKPIPYLSSPSSSSGSNPSRTLATPTLAGNLLSGATSRVFVGFLLCPITVIKTRFESSNFTAAQNATLLVSLRSIWAEAGVKGLFRGFWATALRDAPYAGLYLGFYEEGKTLLRRIDGLGGGEGEEWKARMGSGLIAGTLATLLTHPFDIIKTRLQSSPHPLPLPTPSTLLSNSSTLLSPSPQARVSILSTLRSILSEGGSSSLFLDGLGLRCARKAASSAIGWGIFEAGRDLWVQRELGRRERETERGTRMER
ncbi:mitochondrial carrier [Microstroma glucosiphilum]|uniref:Mitochondrial glycine transporter n=1 Tax=Pseudomicrostroma glucosiphilum TaxID=1684307 RepID=A0A316U9W7_9BASI|nr:mitochondrial carrier [Pseudomicrostroma glucosiphilum]PWN22047.1 mitochondrial carrier [Pseudomicrostroma glucosiphilum]